MAKPARRPLRVIFFRTETGNEPVREWLLKLEEIILLHGIVEKSRTAPKQELDFARKRQSLYLKSTQ